MRRYFRSSRQTRCAPQNRSSRRGARRRWDRACRMTVLCALALCWAPRATAITAESALPAAETFLRHVKGLTNIPGGKVWLCRAEQTLRSCVASLGDARRELIQQQRFLDQRIQQNAQLWETNRPAVAALKAALAKTTTDAPERKQLQQQIQRLEAQAVEPDKLAAFSDVRARLIRFTNARQSLALRLLAIRRAIPEMDTDYRRLEADLEVQAALRTLGEGHRLGPLESYLAELRRLDEFERLVFTPWQPIYLQSGRMRIGAILNERIPITFSWREDDGPTVLTETMLEAAGLELPAGARAVSLPAGRGRTLPAWQMTVPALRFGQVVLRDVPVYVLAPAGEDQGASIGAEAFTGYEVTVERARLQMTIRPQPP